MMRTLVAFTAAGLALSSIAGADPVLVRGRVIDETGAAITEASVLVRNVANDVGAGFFDGKAVPSRRIRPDRRFTKISLAVPVGVAGAAAARPDEGQQRDTEDEPPQPGDRAVHRVPFPSDR